MTHSVVRLGDVCTVGRGSSPRPIKDERFFTGGTIPWVKIADATASGKYIHKTGLFVNEYGASFSRILKSGSLIFPASGTLGIPRFLGVEACVHDGWLYFSDYDGIDPEYLYYKLVTLRDYYLSIAYGAAIQNINTDLVRDTEITLPDFATQRAIAACLCNYDDLIETNRRRIALLEESARLLYREWFVNLRFPGHQLHLINNGIPEGWKVGFAHDCIHVLSGGTPNTKIDRFWGGEIPFFTPKDCAGSMFVLNTEKTLTDDGVTACNSRIFARETIFITARGTVGKLALAQRPMAMNQSCYALTPKEGLHNLFLFLAVENGVAHLKMMASGGVFDAIVVDTFKRMPFILPSLDLTNRFGEVVRPIFDQIECLLKQNMSLADVRDDLLPKLISGEIHV